MIKFKFYAFCFSGVTPEDLFNAPHFREVIPKVTELLDKADIIVGHGLDHDMAVLGFQFPQEKVRDTSVYRPFLKKGGKTPNLKSLTKKYLKEEIQVMINECSLAISHCSFMFILPGWNP